MKKAYGFYYCDDWCHDDSAGFYANQLSISPAYAINHDCEAADNVTALNGVWEDAV
jgi:hypothetical protein